MSNNPTVRFKVRDGVRVKDRVREGVRVEPWDYRTLRGLLSCNRGTYK